MVRGKLVVFAHTPTKTYIHTTHTHTHTMFEMLAIWMLPEDASRLWSWVVHCAQPIKHEKVGYTCTQ